MIVAKNFHSTKASHRGKKEWGGSPASCPEPLSALTKHHKSDSLYSFFFLFYDIYCSFAFPLLLDRWGVSSRSTLKCVQTRFGWCDMCVELLERRPQQKINGAAPLLAWHSLCVKSVFWGRLVELLVRVRNPRRKKCTPSHLYRVASVVRAVPPPCTAFIGSGTFLFPLPHSERPGLLAVADEMGSVIIVIFFFPP